MSIFFSSVPRVILNIGMCDLFLSKIFILLEYMPENPLFMFELQTESPGYLIITQGILAVDTFFLLSGMLTSYLFIREVNKTKEINAVLMVKFYVHRFWRYKNSDPDVVSSNLVSYFWFFVIMQNKRLLENSLVSNKL